MPLNSEGSEIGVGKCGNFKMQKNHKKCYKILEGNEIGVGKYGNFKILEALKKRYKKTNSIEKSSRKGYCLLNVLFLFYL